VPITRGLLQPYERVRRGDLAGTTGSRTPSFPVNTQYEGRGIAQAPVPPTNLPQPLGSISAYTPEPGLAPRAATGPEAQQADTQPVVTLLRPENNDGIWVRFGGMKWVSAGSAVLLRAAEFELIGDYAGFPVFARKGVKENVIYIPTRAGLIAPYRLKP
jgi:hypothetical protein